MHLFLNLLHSLLWKWNSIMSWHFLKTFVLKSFTSRHFNRHSISNNFGSNTYHIFEALSSWENLKNLCPVKGVVRNKRLAHFLNSFMLWHVFKFNGKIKQVTTSQTHFGLNGHKLPPITTGNSIFALSGNKLKTRDNLGGSDRDNWIW